MGGNATVPAGHDDKFKAMRPQDCIEKLFQTKLFDPVMYVRCGRLTAAGSHMQARRPGRPNSLERCLGDLAPLGH